MSTVQMDPGRASSWMGEIEGLNAQLQTELNGVNQSVAEIGQDAAGSVVSQLTQNATQMIDSTSNLVNAFTGLVNAVGNVIGQATGLVGAISDLMQNVKFF